MLNLNNIWAFLKIKLPWYEELNLINPVKRK